MASDAGSIRYTVEVDSKDAEKNLKDTAKEADNLGRALEEADKKSRFENLKKAVSSAKEMILKFCLDSVKGFSDMRSEIAKATGASGDSLESMTASANSALAYLTQSQDEVGRAVGELNTRLQLQGDELEQATIQIGRFARVTGQDMQQSVQGVTKLMAAWGVQADRMPKILNRLAVAGQASGKGVGQLTAELQQNASVFKQFGLSMDEAASMLMTLELQGVESQSAIMGMQMVLRKAATTGQDARTVWDEMTEAIRNAKSDTEANAVATEHFGRQAGKMIEIIRSGKLTFDEFSQALADSEGALDGVASESMTLNDFISQLMNVANSLIGTLGPALKDIFSIINDLMPAIRWLAESVGKYTSALAGLVHRAAEAVRSFAAMESGAESARRKMIELAESEDEAAKSAVRNSVWYAEWSRKAYELSEAEETARKAMDDFQQSARDMIRINGRFIDKDAQDEYERLADAIATAERKTADYLDRIGKVIDADVRASGAAEMLTRHGRELAERTESLTEETEEYVIAARTANEVMDDMLAAKARLGDSASLTAQEEENLKEEIVQLEAEMKRLGITQSDLAERQKTLALSASESFKNAAKDIGSAISPYVSQLKSLGSMLSDTLSGIWANDIARVDEAMSIELDTVQRTYAAEAEEIANSLTLEQMVLEQSLAKGQLTREQYDKRLAALDERRKQRQEDLAKDQAEEESRIREKAKDEKNRIARKEFETQKALQIANAIMNAATAAIQCFAQLGPIAGGIAAAVIAGLTGAQIAVISGTQFTPSYDTGSGVLGSDRMAQLHKGERVLNRADTERLERAGGLSAIAAADRMGNAIAIDNNLTATLDVDGLQLAIAVMRHWDEARAYV